MKKPLHKIFDYLILTTLISVAIVFVLLFNGTRLIQLLTIILLSLLYVLWGIFHHYKEGTLHKRIIFEYFAYALLGCVISIGLLW